MTLKVLILQIDTFKAKINNYKIKIGKCSENEKNIPIVTREN